MDIIIKPCRAGKTTAIIRSAAKHFSYIVCINKREADRVFAQAKDMGLDIPQPITCQQFVNRQWHSGGIKSFVFDNADMLLQQMAGRVPVRAMSINSNPNLLTNDKSGE